MKKINKNSKTFKVFSIIGDVILYTLFILSFLLLMFTISSKKAGDDGVNLFGRKYFTVLTNSMERCDKTWDKVSQYEIKDLKVDTLVGVKTVDRENKEEAKKFYDSIKVGDVLTFMDYGVAGQTSITHRVVNIEPKGDGYIFTCQGDNWPEGEGQEAAKQYIDTTEPVESAFEYVIGKVTFENHFLGSVVTFLKKPMSLVFVVIVPCSLIIVYEAFRITLYFVDRRKEKDKKELSNKDQEIEELKKKLLEAQGVALPEEETKPEDAKKETEAVEPAIVAETEEAKDEVKEDKSKKQTSKKTSTAKKPSTKKTETKVEKKVETKKPSTKKTETKVEGKVETKEAPKAKKPTTKKTTAETKTTSKKVTTKKDTSKKDEKDSSTK